jgi:hypothetical protein
MATKEYLAVGVAAAAITVLAGCGGGSSPADPAPAALKPVPGSVVKQVNLTQQAMHRLGIATRQVQAAAVAQSGQRRMHKVIPYSAVVYDTDGSTWTFVNTETRTFVRQPITVDAIDGTTAVLDRGPAVGAAVVTVGAPELLGAEYEISGEE